MAKAKMRKNGMLSMFDIARALAEYAEGDAEKKTKEQMITFLAKSGYPLDATSAHDVIAQAMAMAGLKDDIFATAEDTLKALSKDVAELKKHIPNGSEPSRVATLEKTVKTLAAEVAKLTKEKDAVSKSLVDIMEMLPKDVYLKRLPALYKEVFRIMDKLGIFQFGDAFPSEIKTTTAECVDSKVEQQKAPEELKTGWNKTRAGELAYVSLPCPAEENVGVLYPGVIARNNADGDMDGHAWTGNGESVRGRWGEQHEDDIVEHLPTCTGWGHAL